MFVKRLVITFLFSVSFIFPTLVTADQPKVEIIAPDKAKSGSKVGVTVKISHRGNNIYHFTQWTSLKANGDEVGRWSYTWDKLPDNENFTKTVKVRVDGDTIIEAEASCIKDGSAGVVHRKIIGGP